MSQISRTLGGVQYWLRMAVWTLAAAAAATLFSGVTWQTPWLRIRESFGVSLVFTLSIVPLVSLTMRRVAPTVGSRFRFPLDWTILILVMMALALAGSVVAIGALRAIGYIGPDEFLEWLRGSLRVSLLMTLIFGISATALEAMRARLNETTIALRTKERDEAEARRMTSEAQLASLESRVNPHFLFNTLNSIAALVAKDPEGAERMTGQLASLLRSSLDSAGSPLVRLEDELKVVRDYLAIERVRFGERLRYSFSLDERAIGTPVPRLSLQTLVENSVKFAVSPRPEGAAIGVRATLTDRRVLVEVEDDGPGFAGIEMPGHGLALLAARLKMHFGDRATMGIDRGGQGGARVWIDLPRDGEAGPVSGSGAAATPETESRRSRPRDGEARPVSGRGAAATPEAESRRSRPRDGKAGPVSGRGAAATPEAESRRSRPRGGEAGPASGGGAPREIRK